MIAATIYQQQDIHFKLAVHTEIALFYRLHVFSTRNAGETGIKILIHDREHHSRINKDYRYAGIEKSDNFQIALLVQKARIRNSHPLFIKPESTNAPPSRKSGKPATSVIFRIFTPHRTTRREYRKFRAHCINAKINRTGRIPLSPNIQ